MVLEKKKILKMKLQPWIKQSSILDEKNKETTLEGEKSQDHS